MKHCVALPGKSFQSTKKTQDGIFFREDNLFSQNFMSGYAYFISLQLIHFKRTYPHKIWHLLTEFWYVLWISFG